MRKVPTFSVFFAAAVITVAAGGSTPALAQSPEPRDDPELRDGTDTSKPSDKAGPGKKRPSGEAAQPKPIPKVLRRPGSNSVPEGGSQRALLLRELYAYLATAQDEETAQRTAHAIEQVWKASVGDTVGLLMARATKAAAGNEDELAIELLDRAVKLAPDSTEVFYRRAMVHFSENDFRRAAGDLQRVLALDPNHYKALEGLAQIFKATDRKKAALAVYRQLYDVYPLYSGAKTAVEELTREIEGQPS